MSEHTELEERCSTLRAELTAAEARLNELSMLPEDPALALTQREVSELLARTAELEVALLDGSEKLAALRADLTRVQSLGGLTQ
jgi:predicted RNase H-like nuclease (RuvC/YqgF family)